MPYSKFYQAAISYMLSNYERKKLFDKRKYRKNSKRKWKIIN